MPGLERRQETRECLGTLFRVSIRGGNTDDQSECHRVRHLADIEGMDQDCRSGCDDQAANKWISVSPSNIAPRHQRRERPVHPSCDDAKLDD